jgi:hypothetical protein
MHGRIGKEMAWEISGFRRWLSDGFAFIEARCDYYPRSQWMDHTPQFNLFFALLNIVIVDFSVYNVNHAPEEE